MIYKFKKNNEIRSDQVRVILNGDNKGILSLKEALKLSVALGLDLIQISEKTDPPVCRVDDYGKFIFNLEKERKKHSKKEHEIRLKTCIDSHDLQIKEKSIIDFIKKGDKVKIVITYKGRSGKFFENDGMELAIKMLSNIKTILGIKNTQPKLSGRSISFLVEAE